MSKSWNVTKLVWGPMLTLALLIAVSSLGRKKIAAPETKAFRNTSINSLTVKIPTQSVKVSTSDGAIDVNDNSNDVGRPPLSSLIGDEEADIRGDVQFLLDFAIVGHPKTGTTALNFWLRTHEEILMYPHEVHSLRGGRPAELVSLLYALPSGRQYKRGYKAPNDIRNPLSMEALRTYWPQTKLIVGLRHPVKWFESWYNFNTRQGNKLQEATFYAGRHFNKRVLYHANLAGLGKTNVLDDKEQRLLNWKQPVPPLMSNPVFLYEVSQQSDINATIYDQFRKDLSSFLGLKRTLDKFEMPRDTYTSRAIDICEQKFDQLRVELCEHGTLAAEWILTYFLPLSDVSVSSPDYFITMLQTWGEDPCKSQ